MPNYEDVKYSDGEAITAIWVTVSTGMIFLMQAGFALVENGSVRQKNSSNILIKNLFDACFGSIAFWLIGFGVAFGNTSEKSFMGTDPKFYASSDFEGIEDDAYLTFIFQFSFAATSATIVSGALAERTNLASYMGFSFLMTSLIYPVVVSWTWGGGWLGQKGFVDFAGSGIVHLVGGVASFFSATIVGPRYGLGGQQIKYPEEVEGF